MQKARGSNNVPPAERGGGWQTIKVKGIAVPLLWGLLAASFAGLAKGIGAIGPAGLAGLAGGGIFLTVSTMSRTLLGEVIGRAVGWTLGGALGTSCSFVVWCSWKNPSSIEAAALGGLVFGAIIGAISGALLGLMGRLDQKRSHTEEKSGLNEPVDAGRSVRLVVFWIVLVLGIAAAVALVVYSIIMERKGHAVRF